MGIDDECVKAPKCPCDEPCGDLKYQNEVQTARYDLNLSKHTRQQRHIMGQITKVFKSILKMQVGFSEIEDHRIKFGGRFGNAFATHSLGELRRAVNELGLELKYWCVTSLPGVPLHLYLEVTLVYP